MYRLHVGCEVSAAVLLVSLRLLRPYGTVAGNAGGKHRLHLGDDLLCGVVGKVQLLRHFGESLHGFLVHVHRGFRRLEGVVAFGSTERGRSALVFFVLVGLGKEAALIFRGSLFLFGSTAGFVRDLSACTLIVAGGGRLFFRGSLRLCAATLGGFSRRCCFLRVVLFHGVLRFGGRSRHRVLHPLRPSRRGAKGQLASCLLERLFHENPLGCSSSRKGESHRGFDEAHALLRETAS